MMHGQKNIKLYLNVFTGNLLSALQHSTTLDKLWELIRVWNHWKTLSTCQTECSRLSVAWR